MTTVSLNVHDNRPNASDDPVKVVVAASPTQRVLEDANRIVYGTDVTGRKLGVIRISASLRRRVLKAMTAENGEKSGLVVMATLACACVEIDGRPVAFPRNELLIDALIDRLEQEGINAVGAIIAREWPAPKDEDELKNS
jgi:hypothetical protein